MEYSVPKRQTIPDFYNIELKRMNQIHSFDFRHKNNFNECFNLRQKLIETIAKKNKRK